jgi:glycosyltransferase involved in cell wall biosynthesis
MSDMRVKLVVKRFPTSDVIGGAEASARRLASQLAHLGAEVDVLSSRYRSDWKREERVPLDNDAGEPARSVSSRETPCGNNAVKWARVRRLPHPGVRFLGTLMYNLSLFSVLIRERRCYDAVLAMFASTDATTAALAGLITKKPLVCKIASSGVNGDVGRLRRYWYGRVVVWLLRRVDRFVSLNSEVRRDLESIGIRHERIVDIPNGVDTGFFRPPARDERSTARAAVGLAPRERLIVGVGRLGPEKSWVTLVCALAALRNARHDWRAVILGAGGERTKLLALARSQGLEDRLTLTSATQDVRPFLHAADVFVLPSLREGLSNALLEAMATGLPCIVSDVPGNSEVITDGVNGRLFPPTNEDALSEAISNLLDDREGRDRLGNEARRSVEARFRLAEVARAYFTLLQSLRPEAAAFPVESCPGDARRAPKESPVLPHDEIPIANREEEPACN